MGEIACTKALVLFTFLEGGQKFIGDSAVAVWRLRPLEGSKNLGRVCGPSDPAFQNFVVLPYARQALITAVGWLSHVRVEAKPREDVEIEHVPSKSDAAEAEEGDRDQCFPGFPSFQSDETSLGRG